MEGVRRKVLWVLRNSDKTASMRRSFSSKLCVYCRLRPADSADHIFSRKFFQVAHRDNLPQVPSCTRCNGQKSALETYLTAVLPMGTRLPSGPDPAVERRLQNNLKLVRELSEADGGGTVFPDGLLGVRTAFKFRFRYLEEYLGMTSAALAFHHFKRPIAEGYGVSFFDLTDSQADHMEQMFHLNCSARVERDLGEGAIRYRGIQAVDDPDLTVWQYQLFGGARLGYSERIDSESTSRVFMVIVARREFHEGLSISLLEVSSDDAQ